MKYWTTKEGKKIKLTKMTNKHLINTIKMLLKNKMIIEKTLEYLMEEYNRRPDRELHSSIDTVLPVIQSWEYEEDINTARDRANGRDY